jgi:hypothetical protein
VTLSGPKPAEVLGFVRGSRRAARAHLQRRQTPPPPIPWDKLAAARNKARHGA